MVAPGLALLLWDAQRAAHASVAELASVRANTFGRLGRKGLTGRLHENHAGRQTPAVRCFRSPSACADRLVCPLGYAASLWKRVVLLLTVSSPAPPQIDVR